MPRKPRPAAEAGEAAPGDIVRWAGSGKIKVIEYLDESPIYTEADVYAKTKLDPAIWRVKDVEAKAWQTPMRLRRGKTKAGVWLPDVPVRIQLFKIAVRFERVVSEVVEGTNELLLRRMRDSAPAYPKLPVLKPKKDSYLVEMDLFDAHFGKLAWEPETGQNYDLRIAEKVYAEAVEDLMNMVGHLDIKQWVLPIGNDFFHVDNKESATTKGTRVDSDGRQKKIFRAGCMAIVKAAELMAAKAPVKIFHVPGIHDEESSFYLACYLEAWFRNSNRVEVDCSPAHHKYLRWGSNLIGYIHGDKIKAGKLMNIMALERKKDWGETTTHEWRQGHLHKQGVLSYVSTTEEEGGVVRNLSSLSATDSWHYENGFVGSKRAAEAYVLHFSKGYVGHWSAQAR